MYIHPRPKQDCMHYIKARAKIIFRAVVRGDGMGWRKSFKKTCPFDIMGKI